MKKLKKLGSLFILVALLNVSFSAFVKAKVYVCDNGECVTTIIDYGSGYSWDVTCSDGSSTSGNVPGATYGGSCSPQVN